MTNKYTIADQPNSTVVSTLVKRLWTMPIKETRRKCFRAMRRSGDLSMKTIGNVCSQHFNRGESLDHCMPFQFRSGLSRMKRGIVPQVFNGQKDENSVSDQSEEPVCRANNIVVDMMITPDSSVHNQNEDTECCDSGCHSSEFDERNSCERLAAEALCLLSSELWGETAPPVKVSEDKKPHDKDTSSYIDDRYCAVTAMRNTCPAQHSQSDPEEMSSEECVSETEETIYSDSIYSSSSSDESSISRQPLNNSNCIKKWRPPSS